MVKEAPVKKSKMTAVINGVYALVLSIVAVVLLGLYVVKDADVLVEVSVGLFIGTLVASILGWVLKKSLIVTFLITTAILLLGGLMLLMQIDFSGL